MDLTRRQLLKNGVIASTAFYTSMLGAAEQEPASQRSKLLGLVEFINEGSMPLDTATGDELDGRLYCDLSSVKPDALITPLDVFYVRTRASRVLPSSKGWQVRVEGLVEHPLSLRPDELVRRAEPMGVHLMECSGNNRATRFGLISVTRWSGVPLAKVLADAVPKKESTRVLISGFDQYASESLNSIPGASWIFEVKHLASAQAFLATHMDGRPLHADHGAPLRLIVPGWYGCACIKWVDSIALVDESAEATSQMREFASRTQQEGIPQFARDYRPAIIEQAAMPTRIEKWSKDRRISYRVVGICWGGSQPLQFLEIRFNPEEDYVRVNHFRHTTNDPWTVWTHDWSPRHPGRYLIRLNAKEAAQARRLNSGYYVREVEISDV